MEYLITLATKTYTCKADFFFFNKKQMLRRKDVMMCREQKSQLLSLSPGILSETATPLIQPTSGKKKELRGSAWGREKRQQRLRNQGTRKGVKRNGDEGARSWKFHQNLCVPGGRGREIERRRKGENEGVP